MNGKKKPLDNEARGKNNAGAASVRHYNTRGQGISQIGARLLHLAARLYFEAIWAGDFTKAGKHKAIFRAIWEVGR